MKIQTLLLCIGISAQLTAQSNQVKDSVDYNTCSCRKIEEIDTRPRYYPALQQFGTYTMFTKLIPWKLVGGEEAFNNLFCKNFQESSSTSGAAVWRAFALTSRNPILLFNHPQDSIGINLTPCQTQFYEFYVNATFEYPISTHVRNYDFEKEFDNYAQSYVDVLCTVFGYNLLEQVFEYMKEDEIRQVIDQINKKYKTDVVYDEDGEYIDYLPIVLYEKRISFSEFIADMFVKTDEQIRPINEIEEERINNIFGVYTSYRSIEAVKKLITPTIRMSSHEGYISFIINSKMLHKPNNSKDKTATEILTKISHFSFDTENGLNPNIEEICLPQSEIAGTGVLIAYTGKNVKLENSSRLVITDGVNISIPSEEVNAEVKNLHLNNKVISGNIILFGNEKDNKTTKYLKRKGFKITATNKEIHFEKIIGK